MNNMPERIYANDANYWHPYEGEAGTHERIQFLEKALVQAIACGGLALPTNQEAVSHGLVCTMDDEDRLMCAVELNSYLQEVSE